MECKHQQFQCLSLIMGRSKWNKESLKASVFYFYEREVYKHMQNNYHLCYILMLETSCNIKNPVCCLVLSIFPAYVTYLSLLPPFKILIDCLRFLVQYSLFLLFFSIFTCKSVLAVFSDNLASPSSTQARILSRVFKQFFYLLSFLLELRLLVVSLAFICLQSHKETYDTSVCLQT